MFKNLIFFYIISNVWFVYLVFFCFFKFIKVSEVQMVLVNGEILFPLSDNFSTRTDLGIFLVNFILYLC